jgi:putative ABC transport system permease protein
MDALLWDLRQAIRSALNAPGFALAAILTLAAGIGANVAMFSVVYGVLLRPLPYRDANQLVMPRAEVDYAGAHRPLQVFLQRNDLKTAQRPYDAIAAIAFFTTNDIVALSGDSGSELLDSAVVSGTFFQTLDGPIIAGRALTPGDDTSPLVVISERLAQRLFGSADRAVGRPLTLTKNAYTIVGVAGSDFQLPSAVVDVWLPAGFRQSIGPRCCDYLPIVRLDAQGTADQARAALQPMFQQAYDGPHPSGRSVRTSAVSLTDSLVSGVRPALLMLFASVLMVLIIACGNLINLLLARHTTREPEFAVRRALGASAGRLLRQLLVESALLAVAGAAGGILLARISMIALARFGHHALPRIDAVQIDRPALLFALGLGLLTTLLTGIAPALRAMRANASPGFGTSAGKATPGGARRLQRTMCVVQIALAVVLLIGAALMSRSLVRLLNVDLGVKSDHVLTASLDLAFGNRAKDADTLARIDRVLERMRAMPGVRAVGVGTSVPPSTSRLRITLRRSGDATDYQAAAVPVSPGYFSAMQMRLLKGRFFTESDDSQHQQVMIMSEDTARRFFGEGDPIGRTMNLPTFHDDKKGSAEMTLIGVTANVKYGGLAAPPDDIVYLPFAQQPWKAPFLVVRTTGDPADFGQTLRHSLASTDKGIVVAAVTPLDQLVLDASVQPQFRTVLLVAFAVFATGIAAIGLYGVIAYAVSRRSREIGIRMALGATSQTVLGMVLTEGLLMAVIGIAIGSAAALMLSTLVASLLYGVTPTDPTSFVVAAAGLLALTLLASYIPARRAARIEPMGALRTE